MEVKCFLFAAFFLVACVAFSTQDELTDVEGKSKSTLFKIVFLSPFHHSTFIASTMISTKKQQQQFIAQRKARSQILFYFASMLRFFFPFILWFSPFLFIFKHRHSNKQRTMVNGYSYHHHFVFFYVFIEPLRIRFHLQLCICAYLRARFPLTKFFLFIIIIIIIIIIFYLLHERRRTEPGTHRYVYFDMNFLQNRWTDLKLKTLTISLRSCMRQNINLRIWSTFERSFCTKIILDKHQAHTLSTR